MLKGHTQIILTNVNTGEQEVHEDDNIITHALEKIFNISTFMNQTPNSSLFPIATKLLGGIMLFDEELTENPNNIHFPTDAHIVGYGNQSAQYNIYRGSYNELESGKTANGFVSVWDFGTSTANGTIKSVARTHHTGGANPLQYFYSRLKTKVNCGLPDSDLSWFPIRYDGEYLYMLKGSSSTHIMRLARVKIPIFRVGIADYLGAERNYEVIASWDTTVFTYTYYYRRGTSYEEARDVTVYADNPRQYEDGQDGYLYCTWNGVDSSRDTDFDYDLNFFKIKYSDGSYEKSETVHARTGTSFYQGDTSSTYYVSCPSRNSGHVCNGIYYRFGATRKAVHVIPLNNTAAYRTISVISDDSNDYIQTLLPICPHNGGVFYVIYHYLENGYQYQNGILYPDGVNVTLEIEGVSSTEIAIYLSDLTTFSDDLVVLSNASNSFPQSVAFDWATNYLGTINNLSSPITKTALQTMKIIYTITDVN